MAGFWMAGQGSVLEALPVRLQIAEYLGGGKLNPVSAAHAGLLLKGFEAAKITVDLIIQLWDSIFGRQVSGRGSPGNFAAPLDLIEQLSQA